MYFILAVIPIILILVLMIGFKWGAARAGGAGYLTALFIASVFFGSDVELLAYAHARALLFNLRCFIDYLGRIFVVSSGR